MHVPLQEKPKFYMMIGISGRLLTPSVGWMKEIQLIDGTPKVLKLIIKNSKLNKDKVQAKLIIIITHRREIKITGKWNRHKSSCSLSNRPPHGFRLLPDGVRKQLFWYKFQSQTEAWRKWREYQYWAWTGAQCHLCLLFSTRMANTRDTAAVPFSHMINFFLFEWVYVLCHMAEWWLVASFHSKWSTTCLVCNTIPPLLHLSWNHTFMSRTISVSENETNKAKRNCHGDSFDNTGEDKPYSSMCFVMRLHLHRLHINTQSVFARSCNMLGIVGGEVGTVSPDVQAQVWTSFCTQI